MNNGSIQQQWRRYLALFVAGGFAMYQFVLQNLVALIAPNLLHELHLNALQVSHVFSSFYIMFLLLQIPAGLLLDRFPNHWVLGFAALPCALGGLLFVTAHNYSLLLLARFLQGIGGAFGFIGALSIARTYFPMRYFVFLAGILESIGYLSTDAVMYTTAQLITLIGWRNALTVFALLGFVFCVLLWACTHPRWVIALHNSTAIPLHQLFKQLKCLLKQPIQWQAALIVFCLFSTSSVFSALWGISTVSSIHHLSLPSSTGLIGDIFLGIATFSPFISWYASTPKRRYHLLIFGGLSSAALLCMILYETTLPPVVLAVALFLLGGVSVGYLICFAISSEHAPTGCHATAMGFINMASMAAGFIISPIMGNILNRYYYPGIKKYPVEAYQSAGDILLLLYLLAALIALILFVQHRKGHFNEHPRT